MIAIAFSLVILWPASIVRPSHTELVMGGLSTRDECQRIGHKLYDVDSNRHVSWDCVETKVLIPAVGK